ncbi:MAG: DUF2764 domain-containing protein [Candidatus Omnitrophica bacterium]|nr:DUF2764 domain-containing protein [Candidatus Omnitrophota bacterium]MBU0896623.1 DUF2764 domain-containing protein [Candidatus Omnitrophota bacterium]MBU1134602.1 DUF2764 domain-containing protein [Candidatus Omnitrophota bacterium]MBU1810536.1 DUF2764 domain-containing protein [Candidatus Omnitrophota bacterium]
MDKYYYFVAQLPALEFGQNTYITREYFLSQAQTWLGRRDFSLLLEADINNFSFGETKKALKEYREFEFNLRKGISLLRKPAGHAASEGKTDFLKQVVTQGSPLDIEKRLLEIRWKFIEEKEAGHYFDLEFLILYFLKLQILEVLFTFNKEKGTVVFDKFCEISIGVNI